MKQKVVALLLAVLLFLSSLPLTATTTTETKATATSDEETIWIFFFEKIGNAYGAAGMMGNLYAESGLKPKNLQNSYEKSLGYTDDSYTTAVDNGTYENFTKDSAGYGLAQWTYSTRKAGLLKAARSAGKSVGDLQLQLEFLWKELSTDFQSVLKKLQSASSVREASDVVLMEFERPADTSETVRAKRASYGETYLNKYASGTEPTKAEITAKNLSCRENRLPLEHYKRVSWKRCKESY